MFYLSSVKVNQALKKADRRFALYCAETLVFHFCYFLTDIHHWLVFIWFYNKVAETCIEELCGSAVNVTVQLVLILERKIYIFH